MLITSTARYNVYLEKIISTSQTSQKGSKKIFNTLPSKHLLISKTSSRRLQDGFTVTIFCLPRRIEDIFKTPSRRFGIQEILTLKTSSRQKSWRPKNSLMGRNLHLYITNLYLERQIQDASIRISMFIAFLYSNSIFIVRLKISGDCLML